MASRAILAVARAMFHGFPRLRIHGAAVKAGGFLPALGTRHLIVIFFYDAVECDVAPSAMILQKRHLFFPLAFLFSGSLVDPARRGKFEHEHRGDRRSDKG